jgi:hypothetical protein
MYDFRQSVWFLAWMGHALTHGLNPFFSNSIFVPSGVNLAQNTSSPLLGLVTAPLSPVLDPIGRANLLVVLAMPLSATSAFFVFRRWRVVWPAAALGGLVFGFSPYMVDQNVEVIFLPLVPLLASVVVAIFRGAGSALKLGIALGLLVTAQYLISPEILTISLLFAVVGAIFVAVKAPKALVRNCWQPLAIALAVSATLLAYPIWMMTAGPQHFVGRTWPTINYWHNDAFSFLVPEHEQKISFGLRSIGARLEGGNGATGTNGYIGVVILVVAVYLIWQSRHRLRTQVSVVLLVLAMILSLGPYLSVNGRQTGFPLPFLLLDHMPFFNDILPSRVSFVTEAGLASVIAFGLDDRLRVRRRRARSRSFRMRRVGEFALIAGVLVGILVATPLPQEVPQDATAVALPPGIRQAVPGNDPIAITYPFPSSLTMEPMLWQSDDSFRFRLLGGYAYHPDPKGKPDLDPSILVPRGLEEFLVGQDKWSAYILSPVYGNPLPVSQALVSDTRATLLKYGVKLVIVDTAVGGSAPVVTLFREALGPPSVTNGNFSLWIRSRQRPSVTRN